MHCSLVNAQVVTMSVTVPVGRCVLLKGRVALLGATLLLGVSVCQKSSLGVQQPKPSRSSHSENLTTLDLKKLSKAIASVLVTTSDGKTINQGSGFFLNPTGRLVTNYHVIEDASSAIVKTSDGGFYEVNGTLAVDEEHDLAILKVAGSNFEYVSLGDSDAVSIGDKVYAVGSPLGLETTVSDGIVSSIRELNEVRLIQTTAPISHGSSGGPLLNLRGQVIGVTTLQMEGGQNLNFAVPSKFIRPLLLSEKVTPFAPTPAPESPQASGAKNARPKVDDDFSDLPEFWTEALGKSEYRVRILGEHIYIKSTFMENSPGIITDRSLNCDGKRQVDMWIGTCSLNFTEPWMYQSLPTSCSLSLTFRIDSLSKQRIDGRVQNWEFGQDVKIGDCPKTKNEYYKLTLIPQ
jgi:Trypsin-like peptidase domain